MKRRIVFVISAVLLCITIACHVREPRSPEVDIAKLFAGFTYLGSYPSSPLLRVPESQVSHEESPPTYAKSGFAFVFRKATNDTFETLSQSVLPQRLRAQGFAIEATPGSNVSSYATFDHESSFTIAFSRGRCFGYLFGRQRAGDEKFVLQLDRDSGCSTH